MPLPPVALQTPIPWIPPTRPRRSPPCSGWRRSCRPASACRGGPSASSWSTCSRLPSATGSAGPSRASSSTGGRARVGRAPALGGPLVLPTLTIQVSLPQPSHPSSGEAGTRGPRVGTGGCTRTHLPLKLPSHMTCTSQGLVCKVKRTVMGCWPSGQRGPPGTALPVPAGSQDTAHLPALAAGRPEALGLSLLSLFLSLTGSSCTYHTPRPRGSLSRCRKAPPLFTLFLFLSKELYQDIIHVPYDSPIWEFSALVSSLF